ncbi:unnamed protein product [[Candida] boidinii]|uniref:Unnamed protein product n=1 Tax=Candida boidinii TaxID=5477 RepID=A0A9W6T6Y2_CANBO|nr:unnamed protein product [[Candida] boidinii]
MYSPWDSNVETFLIAETELSESKTESVEAEMGDIVDVVPTSDSRVKIGVKVLVEQSTVSLMVSKSAVVTTGGSTDNGSVIERDPISVCISEDFMD